MSIAPRVVVVTRRTAYEQLLARHATRNQAAFFLQQRGQSLDEVEAVHHQTKAVISRMQAAIPLDWRRNIVMRRELDRFLFEPSDVVAVVGQDGLVANVAKYLNGQLVIGVNPTPELFDGILVPHTPGAAVERLEPATRGAVPTENRTLVQAELDDGQTLCALNELYLGQRNHQSARYELSYARRTVTHSSSGVIVATGTGCTGWARSIHLERRSQLRLPNPCEPQLVYFVREAFPSVASSTELTEGAVLSDDALSVTSRMESGVIFGDGMEADCLQFEWGVNARLSVASAKLRLVS